MANNQSDRQKKLVKSLKNLGLTEYESRVYIALVGLGEATARDVHRTSRVPRTKVYEVLRDLVDKGFVEVTASSPAYYRAVDPDTIITRLRDEFLSSINETLEDLKSIGFTAPKLFPVWCTKSEWGIENKIKEFIGKAREELVIATNNPEFLRKYRHQLGKTKADVIVISSDRRLKGLRLNVAGVREEYSDIFSRFISGFKLDNVTCRIECVMIIDKRESLEIHRIGDEKIAVNVKLPTIPLLFRTVLLNVIAERRNF